MTLSNDTFTICSWPENHGKTHIHIWWYLGSQYQAPQLEVYGRSSCQITSEMNLFRSSQDGDNDDTMGNWLGSNILLDSFVIGIIGANQSFILGPL